MKVMSLLTRSYNDTATLNAAAKLTISTVQKSEVLQAKHGSSKWLTSPG